MTSLSEYDYLNKNVLTVDGRWTASLPQRRQLAVYSRCVEPQPQRLGCRLLTELLCHLTLMRLPSISSSTTRLPVFGQLLRALINLGSLQPRSGVSSVSILQSHGLRSSRWCLLCLTSTACLTVCRRGYSRRATACLRRSCARSSASAKQFIRRPPELTWLRLLSIDALGPQRARTPSDAGG